MALGNLVVVVGAQIQGFMDAMDSVSDRLAKVGDDFEKNFQKFQDVGQRMALAGAELSAAITLPLIGAAKASLEAAGSFEQAEVAFTTLLGSADKAKTLFQDLVNFAARTPFQIPGVIQSSQQLLALGFDAQQIIPMLTVVGDAAAGLGRGDEGLQRILYDLGQLKNEGVANKRVMNELAMNGVASFQMLADYLGKSIPQVLDMLHNKEIDSSTALTAILTGMQTKFGGLMDKQANTLLGAWSNIKDNLTKTFAAIGTALMPAAKGIEAAINAILAQGLKLADWFSTLPSPVQNAAIALAGMLAAIGPLLVAIGGITMAVGTLGTALAPFAAFLGVSVVALGGWAVAIAAALAALVALGTWVYDNWNAITAVMSSAWEGLKELFAPVVNVIVASFTAIKDAIVAFTAPVVDWLIGAWNTAAGAIGGIWGDIKGAIVTAWNYVMSALQKGFDWLKQLPGMDKLLNLPQVWHDAEKASTSIAKTSATVQKFSFDFKSAGEAAAKAGKETDDWLNKINTTAQQYNESQNKLAANNEKVLAGLSEIKQVSIDTTNQMQFGALAVIKAWEQYDAEMKQIGVDTVHSMGQTATQSFNLWQDAVNSGKGDVLDWYAATQDTLSKIQDIYIKTGGRVEAGWSENLQHMMDALKAYLSTIQDSTAVATQRMADAYHDLGLKTASEADAEVDKRKADLDLILGDTNSSLSTRLAAEIAYQKAVVAADEASNSDQLQNDRVFLGTLEDQQKASVGKRTGMWADFGKQVSTIVTDLGRDISNTLFDGTGSFGQRMLGVLEDIGKAFVRAFVEAGVNAAVKPLMSAITGLIANLGSGKGGLLGVLSTVWDTVKNIGSGIAGVFGKVTGAAGNIAGATGSAASVGGSIAGAAGSVGSAAGSAAGGIGGILGSASGLISGIGAIGGILGAAGSIFSGFEIRGQTKVQENIQNILEGEILPCLVDKGIAQPIWNTYGEIVNLFNVMKDFASVTAGQLTTIYRELVAIGNFEGAWIFQNGINQTNSLLAMLVNKGTGGAVTINISGVIDQSAANAVADAVTQKLQLAGYRV